MDYLKNLPGPPNTAGTPSMNAMEFFFENDKKKVGTEVEAYCPKCGALSHTVLTVHEGDIRRVQCNVCSDVHPFRRPRGEIEEDQEPVTLQRRHNPRMAWDEAVVAAQAGDLWSAQPFSVAQRYHEGEIVTHQAFGLGFVSDVNENKVEITFENETKLLAHGRADLLGNKKATKLTGEQKKAHAKAIETALAKGGKPTESPEKLAARKAREQAARIKAEKAAKEKAVRDAKRAKEKAKREAQKAKDKAKREMQKAKEKARKEAQKAKEKARKDKVRAQREAKAAKAKALREAKAKKAKAAREAAARAKSKSKPKPKVASAKTAGRRTGGKKTTASRRRA